MERTKTFTLVEIHYLSPVQLSASQTGQVAVSNFSAASVTITMEIISANGNIVAQKTNQTVTANHTFVLNYTNGNAAGDYYAVVTASVAGAIATDFQVLGSNGEVTAIALPFINSVPGCCSHLRSFESKPNSETQAKAAPATPKSA